MLERIVATTWRSSMSDFVEKHAFLAGCACPTFGWLEHRGNTAPMTPGIEWRFHFGNEIGVKARAALGEGTMIPRAPLDVAASASTSALGDPCNNALLFEVTFVAVNCVARADALRRGAGGWELVEVKSGKSPEDGEGPKAAYLDDIGFTLFVARASGLRIDRALLMMVNRDYRTDLDESLFVELDVTTEASARAERFATSARAITDAVLADEKPDAMLKFACGKCPRFGECVGAGIDDHLFIIPRLSEKKFGELRQFERIANIPAASSLTDLQRRIVDVCKCGQALVEPDGLTVLDNVIWPAYYLDFEAVIRRRATV
jgi:hypothetical protein